MEIEIHFRNGTVQRFRQEQSYGNHTKNSVEFVGQWVVVTDSWGTQTAFPAELVRQVTSVPAW